MDSRALYSAIKHLEQIIEWEKVEGSEWEYIWTNDEFNIEKATKIIDEFFKEDEVYIVIDRRISYRVNTSLVLYEVKENLNDQHLLSLPCQWDTKKLPDFIQFYGCFWQ